MKYWTLLMILLIVPMTFAQTVPPPASSDTTNALYQKIDQEHKNTRKFVSDELTRQREEWVKAIDDRANYYEATANNLINTATWKFGLVWAGVTFFILSINSLLRTRVERKKYDKLKKALVGEATENLMTQLNSQQKIIQEQMMKMQQETNLNIQNYYQKMNRMVAEPQRQRPQAPPMTAPPLMDYEGRPMRSQAPQIPQPTQEPRMTMAELQELMRQNAQNAQQRPQVPSFEQLGIPSPPPYTIAPAPRKLGFFERRREAKLQKELAYIQKLNAKRNAEEARIKEQLFKINPFQ